MHTTTSQPSTPCHSHHGRTWHTRAFLLTFLLLTCYWLNPAHAQVSCQASDTTWNVGTEVEFNDAIACFNGKRTGDYAINLTGNIVLTASTTLINNASTLTINGNNHAIDGQNNSGVRPIEVASGTTVIINSTTITKGNVSGFGAGIINVGTLTLNNSSISGNTTNDDGGGIFNKGGLTLANSSISGNTANNNGGGISNIGTLTLTNSTISGNRASSEGGGISNKGTLTLTNSTVSGNEANSEGGGISNKGNLTLINSIIADSISGGDCVDGGRAIGTHNLIEDSTNACRLTHDTDSNIIGFDPKLGSLANNGGATQTHVLLANSPAIDAGTTGADIPIIDQRDFVRDSAPDIGAYEFGSIGVSELFSDGFE